jgi:hypothetical protein
VVRVKLDISVDLEKKLQLRNNIIILFVVGGVIGMIGVILWLPLRPTSLIQYPGLYFQEMLASMWILVPFTVLGGVFQILGILKLVEYIRTYT